MVVRKFNYYRFFVFIAILVATIVIIVLSVKRHNYKETYDYKLSVVGYSEEETQIIKDKLDNDKIEILLTKGYDSNLVGFLQEKYFLYKNLDKYLEYKKLYKSESLYNVVAIVNTEADVDWIDNMKEADTSKGNLILINRIYGVDSDYTVDDIIKVPAQYAYSGVKISESILDDIIMLIDAAKESGYTIVLSDGYRSYKDQEKLYNSYKNSAGIKEADRVAARPGHSEYETGISFNIVPYNKVYESPKESEEYKWLYDNAYRYGFIFRLPDDKEKLTGFEASTWRLRYVGYEAASIMKSENLCFEEYYAYYVDKE